MLAAALPNDSPSVVVLDEVPYLMDDAHAFEGALQRHWDRYLSRKSTLLILIGSDLSMMETLNSYERPFHQRGREMIVGPLNPAEIAIMLDLSAADAFDAALVTGGLPLICTDWHPSEHIWSFLGRSLADPTSPLLVSAERSLAAEFPEQALACTVLSAIGSGERTFTNIGNAAGGIAAASLNRALTTLVDKRMVAAELPLSMKPSKQRRYRITDPYLRFWLRFLAPSIPEIERGRGDLALQRIHRDWNTWRGRAVEPLLREALARLVPDQQLPAANVIGGYWARSNDIEIDIVGVDRAPLPVNSTSSDRSNGSTRRSTSTTSASFAVTVRDEQQAPTGHSLASLGDAQMQWDFQRARASGGFGLSGFGFFLRYLCADGVMPHLTGRSGVVC